MRVNAMPVLRIDSDDALRDAARAWMQQERVALDTEFMRERTFYARAALYQVCDGERCFLVDPLAIADFAPLAALLESPRVLKIMHSCSEDLELFDRQLGVLPVPLLDTQIVAAFCGPDMSIGYSRIVRELLDVQLDKSETRTDWLRRPLSEAQLKYAAEDVAYLPRLWELQRAQLVESGRLQWAVAECEVMLDRYRARGAEGAWRELKGAAQFDRRSLAVLRELYRWRELAARQRDLPRSWVLGDAQLLQIAAAAARGETRAQYLEGLPPSAFRRYAAEIERCVDEGMAVEEADLPAGLPSPPDRAARRDIALLRSLVQERAQTLGMAPEMLARRRDLEELVRMRGTGADRAAAEIQLLSGWRSEAIGKELLQRLEELHR